VNFSTQAALQWQLHIVATTFPRAVIHHDPMAAILFLLAFCVASVVRGENLYALLPGSGMGNNVVRQLLLNAKRNVKPKLMYKNHAGTRAKTVWKGMK
jgi:hypothetical protein